jgi:S-adenosylmethionine:tRNA-ribosyltransferase-isomerase (queuine synthetase)
MPEPFAAEIAATKAAGGRVIPGTTALRLIETAGRADRSPRGKATRISSSAGVSIQRRR